MTQALFDRATNAATCDFLSSTGQGAAAYAAWGLLTPGPFDEFGAIAYAALAKMAYDQGCSWDPNQPDPNPQTPIKGCSEVIGGVGTIGITQVTPGTFNPFQAASATQAVKIVDVVEERRDQTSIYYTAKWEIAGSEQLGAELFVSPFENPTTVSIIPTGDATCGKQEEPTSKYDYDYTDQETGCSLTVSMEGYSVDSGNRVSPVWRITAAGDGVRANGGVISGDCNFAPTLVIPDPNGPGPSGPGGPGGPGGPTYLPIPDDPTPGPNGEPWWQSVLAGVAGGATAALIDAALQAFFDQKYDGLIYRMVSVCEKSASGEPISEAVEVPIPALKAPDAQLARLDAIVELLQAHKNFKQPVCPNERPKLDGDWRTISFRSATTSPYGRACLRKRFRYRSLSGLGLGDVVDHWKDFAFESGEVVVSHKGFTWGTPQVWAATADEGKRVIQHAAREAGFDADQVGQWVISSCTSARYGVSAQMSVDTRGGYYWITSRDGSNDKPIVALTSDP